MRRASGFTLVELMVVVAVVAILAAVALPGVRGVVRNNRLVAGANEIVAMIQIARMEAIRRRVRVVVCPSADGATCAGAAWARSIAFADVDRSGQVNGGEEVIREMALNANGFVVNSSTRLAGAGHRLGFSPNGYALIGGAGIGAISICSPEDTGTNARDVTVVISRVSVRPRAAGSGCGAHND